MMTIFKINLFIYNDILIESAQKYRRVLTTPFDTL